MAQANPPSRGPRHTVGCVSFLNARPLIDGLDDLDDLAVRYDVPSRLLADLLAGEVDLALCPVVDYQTADRPLMVVPAGGIGCDGATLTVRLFSRVPVDRVRTIRADTDSHTSIVLMRLLLHDLYGAAPEVAELAVDAESGSRRDAESMLLIGDKVVTHAPDDAAYPHQLDLGVAWKELTGLPFVFAVWMALPSAELGDVPRRLADQRRANADRIDAIVADRADAAGWPRDLARRYLGSLLRYRVGPRELEAMQRFWRRSWELGLLPNNRPLDTHGVRADQPVG